MDLPLKKLFELMGYAPIAISPFLPAQNEWWRVAYFFISILLFFGFRLLIERMRGKTIINAASQLHAEGMSIKSISHTKDGAVIEFYETQKIISSEDNNLTVVK